MTQGTALVSAIVVTYRSRDVVSDLLSDLDGVVDEIVVVDNASDDDTVAVATKASAKVRCIVLPRNAGFAAGVNQGVAAAQGRYLFLVNPDIRVPRDTIARLLAANRRHPGDVVGPRVRFPDGRVQVSRSGIPSLWTLLGEQVLVPEGSRPDHWPARVWPRWRSYEREEVGPVLSGCALFVSHRVWQRVGPFDERYFLFWEEVDWQVRAHHLGHRSWLVPDAEVVHGRGCSSDVSPLQRTELFYAAAHTYVHKWFPAYSRWLAQLILWSGQAVRLLVWSLPPGRSRPVASLRRDIHRTAMRTLWKPEASAPGTP